MIFKTTLYVTCYDDGKIYQVQDFANYSASALELL